MQVGEKELKVYFDQYEWKEPKLLSGFEWKESRIGYHGELINGEIFNGYGLYFFEDGGYYKGLWKNGMMEGYGEMLIPDQEKYIGNFSQGKYHGEGTLYYQDGGRHVGRWKNGLKEGNGKLYYPPGCDILYIEGNFENDESTGDFKIVNSNGTEELYVFGK